jgi:hypothetical protein
VLGENISVVVERVEMLEQEPSGKVKSVHCALERP